MAYKEHKLDSKLVESPVEEVCGNPTERKHPGAEGTIYGLQGPEGVSANGGIEFALIYDDVTSSKSADMPSDAKQFKGQSEV